MNPQAILALLGDLYQQITALQAKVAELEDIRREMQLKIPMEEGPRPVVK